VQCGAGRASKVAERASKGAERAPQGSISCRTQGTEPQDFEGQMEGCVGGTCGALSAPFEALSATFEALPAPHCTFRGAWNLFPWEIKSLPTVKVLYTLERGLKMTEKSGLIFFLVKYFKSNVQFNTFFRKSYPLISKIWKNRKNEKNFYFFLHEQVI
jgi:hypothetical protein